MRAQLRWDNLTQCIAKADANGWLYHKILYIPRTSGRIEGLQIPPEGCLRIYRSHVNEACYEAMQDPAARNPTNNSENINYYRAYREAPSCIEMVLPRAIYWSGGNTIQFVNEIQWDERPRLISKFWNRTTHQNLGFYEIISVRDSIYGKLFPRSPLKERGEEVTSSLSACNAEPCDSPRWVKFAHVVGEDRCSLFLKKSLLPMMGPRPTGNTWRSELK